MSLATESLSIQLVLGTTTNQGFNESFADLFGAMVDRDDWLIGEDLYNDGPH